MNMTPLDILYEGTKAMCIAVIGKAPGWERDVSRLAGRVASVQFWSTLVDPRAAELAAFVLYAFGWRP